MATYAAFKHVELYNVGSGKRRVLKPPGGGSSDIFAGSDAATTPRSIKNHMKSNIFAAPSPIRGSTGDGRRGTQADDSHSRLFGSDRAFTPAKNRLKSNIPIGGDEADSSLKHTNGNGHTNSTREHIAGSDNGKSCRYNENYSDSTDNLLNSSKYYGYDVNLCKASQYLNPTFNSKINLCINDDYISIVNNGNNNRNPSGFRQKRESKFFDENMNYATPLINNAHESKICRKTLNSSLPTDGNSLNGETIKPSGENVAPNHVVNKNRIPPGGFSSGLW